MVYLNFSSQRVLMLRHLIGREVTGLGKVLILLLALGVFIQLSGLLLNNDGSRYATQLYLALFLPALLLLLRERLMPTLWRQAPAILLLLLLGWVLLYAGVHPGSDKDFWRWLKLVLLLIFYVAAVASLAHHERHSGKVWTCKNQICSCNCFQHIVCHSACQFAICTCNQIFHKYSSLLS